jgi:hypothetical protein
MANLPGDFQAQDDPVQPTSSGVPAGKERAEAASGQQEVTPITEFTRNVDLEPEVEGWLEKLEKEDAQLKQPVVNQQTGQIVLDDASQQSAGFKVVLPLTKDEMEKGLKHKVVDSLRWLAEWCLRLIKMFGSKVAYKRA